MIKYEIASDIKERMGDIINKLKLPFPSDRIICIRSYGSKSRGTIARCHALSRIWQKSLGIKTYYVIEVIAEKFDKESEEEKIKTLVHELLHIPKAFGGGFKGHRVANKRKVERLYKEFIRK